MADTTQKMKMAIIAGASKALKYKEQNQRASDTEILRMVAKDISEIMHGLDQDI